VPNRLRFTDSISLLFSTLSSRTSGGMVDALKPLGLQPRETGILASVNQFGAMSQRRLSQLLGIDRSTMVTCVDRLEGLKLVEREPCPNDRRVTLITLTARGEQAVRDAKRQLDTFEAQMLAPLTKAEQMTLRETLGKISGTEKA
jgi:DNA-binding MarR family transcriptional regulator